MAMFGSSWDEDSYDRKIGPMSSWVNDESEYVGDKDSEISLFSRWKDKKPKIKVKKDNYNLDLFSRWKK